MSHARNRVATLSLDDEILRVVYDDNAEVALPDAEEGVLIMGEITQGHRVPMLVDLRPVRSVTRDARKRYAQNPHMTAVAMLVDTGSSRSLANLYLQFSNPPIPLRAFTSQPEALRWLEAFVRPDAVPRDDRTRITPSLRMTREAQFIRATYFPDVHETLEVAKTNMDAFLELTGGEHMPALIDARQLVSIHPDAREFYRRVRYCVSTAIIIDSNLSRVLGNFFISLNIGSNQTVRLFTTEAEAVAWLERQGPQ